MRLVKLILNNFRLFSDTEIVFPESNVVGLIGNNASGKTTILDAIALALTHFTGELFSKTVGYNIDSWFIDDDITKGKTQGQITIEFDFEFPPPNNIFEFEKELKTISVFKELNTPGLTFKKKPENFLNEYKSLIQKNKLTSIPIVSYQNVNRTWNQKKDSKKEEYTYNEKLIAYEKALDIKTPSFNSFENWFIKQIGIENALKVKNNDLTFELPTLTNVRKAFKVFMGVMEPEIDIEIYVDRELKTQADISQEITEYVAINKASKQFKFNQLSSGERMIISLVCEVSRRLTIANENHQNALEGFGVVLIDELELHLHPNWQRNIVSSLVRTFPNIQFIFSTHSPLVVSGLKRENLIPSFNGTIVSFEELPDIYSATADEVLEDILFARPSITDFDSDKEKIDRLFNELKFIEAKNEINKLKIKVGSYPQWLEDYDQRINFALSNK